jgi:two-component system, NarL family, nitrate/nitrite response regulator NarL
VVHERARALSVHVVDPRTLVVDGITAAAANTDDIRVVGASSSIRSLSEELAESRPDVVIVGGSLPDTSLARVASAVRSEGDAIAVVVLGGTPTPGSVAEVLRAGCAGFVDRSAGMAQLFDVVRRVAAGEVVILGAASAPSGASRPDVAQLNARELEVLQLLARGMSTDEIVGELRLSKYTVRNHIHRVLTKLGARSRLEAVATGMRLGLIEHSGN